MKPGLLAILAAGVALIATHVPANALDKGWWVVLASFPQEPWERQRSDAEAIGRKAEPCGLKVFNDLSGKFRGFAPGRNVFVVGAFLPKPRAEEQLRAARPCFPDAYLKYGSYAGE